MGFSTVPLVTRGDLWTAADHNKYIRDNFAATEQAKVTTAGDMVYATGEKAIDRLALTPNAIMKSGASAPEWYAIGDPFSSLRTNLAKTDVEWSNFPPGEILTRTTGTQQVSIDTLTPLVFDTAQVNLYGFWSAAAPTRITIPADYPTIVYYFSGSVGYMNTTVETIKSLSLRLNGTLILFTQSGIANVEKLNFSGTFSLSAGNYVELVAFHKHGNATVTWSKLQFAIIGLT